MEGRKLTILLLITLGLLGFIFFYERHRPTTDERGEEEKYAIKFDPAAITKLKITGAGKRVALAKTGGKWLIVEPFQYRADAGAVQSLLGSVAALTRQRRLESANLAEMGLDPPRATLVVESSGKRHELEIGADIPASGNLAMRVRGDPAIYIVPRQVAIDLERDPDAWRDRQILDLGNRAIRRIALERGSEVLEFERRGPVPPGQGSQGSDGMVWMMTRPISDRADLDILTTLLRDMTGLKADRFLGVSASANAKQYSLDPPSLRVLLYPEGAKQPERLDFGASFAEDPNLNYGRHEGVVFAVDNLVLDDVKKEVSAFRERRLVSAENWQVRLLDLDLLECGARLEQRDGSWFMGEKRLEDAEEREIISALEFGRAESFLSEKEARDAGIVLTRNAGKITVGQDNSGTRDYTLYSMTGRPGHFAIKEAGRADYLVTSGSFRERLVEALRRLPPPEIAPAPPASKPPAASPAPGKSKP